MEAAAVVMPVVGSSRYWTAWGWLVGCGALGAPVRDVTDAARNEQCAKGMLDGLTQPLTILLALARLGHRQDQGRAGPACAQFRRAGNCPTVPAVGMLHLFDLPAD